MAQSLRDNKPSIQPATQTRFGSLKLNLPARPCWKPERWPLLLCGVQKQEAIRSLRCDDRCTRRFADVQQYIAMTVYIPALLDGTHVHGWWCMTQSSLDGGIAPLL
jgi:hypothetical protein